MASSFMVYGDRGFWARDCDVALVLYLMRERINTDHKEFLDHLEYLVSEPQGGAMALRWDELLPRREDLKSAIIAGLDRVCYDLVTGTMDLSAERLNELGIGGGAGHFIWIGPAIPEEIREVALRLRSLLVG